MREKQSAISYQLSAGKLGSWGAVWCAKAHPTRSPVPCRVGLGPPVRGRLGACVQRWVVDIERWTFPSSLSFFWPFPCGRLFGRDL